MTHVSAVVGKSINIAVENSLLPTDILQGVSPIIYWKLTKKGHMSLFKKIHKFMIITEARGNLQLLLFI